MREENTVIIELLFVNNGTQEVSFSHWGLEEAALGIRYFEGDGVERDYAKAFQWLQKPAESGNTKTQAYVGLMYYRGIGAEENEEKGIEMRLRAAEQKDPDALYWLGDMVRYSEPEKALKYFEQSAALRHVEAQVAAGLAYRFGRGGTGRQR